MAHKRLKGVIKGPKGSSGGIMADQFGAVTGMRRRRRGSAVDVISAKARTLPARRAIEQEEEFRQAALDEQRRVNELSMRMRREEFAEAQKQARTSQLISGVGTVAQGGMAAKQLGLIGGKAAPAMTAGQTAALTTQAQAALPAGETVLAVGGAPTKAAFTASASELAAPATTEAITAEAAAGAAGEAGAGVGSQIAQVASKFALPAAVVTGLQLAHDQGGEWLEEQVGTSAKHAGRIGTRIGQGAMIGSVIPGIGTAVGAVIGGTVGVIEESWGWVEEQTSVGQAKDWWGGHMPGFLGGGGKKARKLEDMSPEEVERVRAGLQRMFFGRVLTEEERKGGQMLPPETSSPGGAGGVSLKSHR